MALNFPTNPTPGQTYTGDNGVIYTYDGVKWTGAGVETGFTLPVASTTTAGVVRVDGTTITIANGVISANVQGGGGGTYSNANVASYLTAFNGNILPSANVTYSLGSSTRQWRDLWVSNNTIYIGNVPLTVSNGNLLVNGSLVTGSGSGTDDVLRANVGAYQTFANSNAATQSTDIATLQAQVYANANVAAYLPTYTGNIAGNIVKNGYTWAFGTDGKLTVPASGTITAPINQEFRLQARDTNSVLRNEIELDPNNGTYMSVWSDGTTSFSSADWDTGSWNNESGLGAARFTDAQALQNFWTTGIGSLGLPIEASINGGARTPNVFYENNNGETYGVFLGLDAVPPGGQGTTVPITSLVFYYQTQSKINIDRDGGEILLDAQSMDLDLRTTNILDLRAGENLNLRGLGQYPVRIYTDDTTHKWEFDNTGSLTLPREGKIYGIGDGGPGGDRYGYISWDGNSSGDGSGYNTMRLVPDQQGLEDLDTYIILDPAYVDGPGSIHIRAGGTRDNSLANLYLGGANSHVKIGAGSNPPVTVMANNRSWTFGNTGTTRFPDGTILAPAGQTITMQSDQNSQLLWQNANIAEAPNVPTNTTFSVQPNFATLVVGYRDGNSADQDNTWLWNIDGMTLPEGGTITEGGGISGAIRLTPAGGANSNQALVIYPTAGGDGDHIHLTAGGGTTELYLGSDNHYVKLVDGGDVEIRTDDLLGNTAQWMFGTDGSLTLPTGGNLIFDSSSTSIIDGVTDINAVGTIGANVIQVLSDLTSFGASPAPRIYGFRSIATTGSAVNEGNISASGNLVASQNAYVTGNVFAKTIITPPVTFANLSAVSGARAFVNDANITAAGNFGAAISGGGSNVAPVWSDGVNWYIG